MMKYNKQKGFIFEGALIALAVSSLIWAFWNAKEEPKIQSGLTLGAPYFRQEKDIVPVTDSTHYLGTTTPSTLAWLRVIADSFYDTDASDGCASWASNVLTSTGSACGSGSGGGNSKWASSTNGTLISPNGGTTLTVVIGATATSVASVQFEVVGGAMFDRSTSTSATSTSLFATTASTTNFYGAGLTPCTSNNVLTWTGGKFGCEADDAGASAYDAWTHPSAGVSATTSSMIFTNASSTFTGNLNISGNSTTTNATTTNLAISSLTATRIPYVTTGGALTNTELSYSNAGARVDLTATAGDGIGLFSDTSFFFQMLGGATDDNYFFLDNTDTEISNKDGLYKFNEGATYNAYGILNFANIDTSDKTFTFPNESGTFGLLGTNQTWTGANIFNNITRSTTTQATTTSLFSNLLQGNSLRIGGSATSTINTSGDLLVVGSTTLQNFTAVNSTSTNATTTALFSTTASSTNLFTSNLTVKGFAVTVNGAPTLNDWFDQSVKQAASPTFNALTLTTALTVGNGGTGATSLTDHGVLIGSGTGAITPLAVGTNGQILVGSTGADPVFTTLTCADGLTCTTGAGTLEIDFDGGDSPGGSLGGTWASPTIDDLFIKLGGDVATAGTYDFGEASVILEIPNGTGSASGAAGVLTLDTTSNNLTLATSTSGHIVVASATTTLYSFSASTTAITSGTIIDMPSKPLPQVITAIWCKVSSSTSLQMFISDGTNDTNTITCTTTGAQYAITANNTFTANEAIRMEFGTKTGDTGYLSVDIRGYKTSD